MPAKGEERDGVPLTNLDQELFTDEEIGTTCCFATQDKVWVTGPAGEKWEVYTVLADSETFGCSPQTAAQASRG